MDRTRCHLDDRYQRIVLCRVVDPAVSRALFGLELVLTGRWFLMDRAGRRPILLSGAVAMAIALTATGWWIYIDQAITPKAGEHCLR